MADPFGDRLDALEARLDDLRIGDLPFAAIQRKLEQDWQPNGATLLGSNSVTAAMLAGLKFAGGKVTVTWGGASPVSAVTPVLHGLDAVPTTVELTPLVNTNMLPVVASAPDATTLSIVGVTNDGSPPAAGFARDIYWLAVLIG